MNQEVQDQVYVTFAGVVDQEATKRIFFMFQQLVARNVKRVHLLIQSSGGTVEDGIAAFNYLRNLPLDIVTYNVGAVQSISVLLYLVGKVRKCSRHASFLIHKTTHAFQSPTTGQGMLDRAAVIERCDRNTDEILRNYIAMPDDRWAIRERTDLVIWADEAREFGLVNEIDDFKPPAGSQLFNI